MLSPELRAVLRAASGIPPHQLPRDPRAHYQELHCLDCPNAANTPPFARLDHPTTHHRKHLRAHPAHRIAIYCHQHSRFESLAGVESATWDPYSGLQLTGRARLPKPGACQCCSARLSRSTSRGRSASEAPSSSAYSTSQQPRRSARTSSASSPPARHSAAGTAAPPRTTAVTSEAPLTSGRGGKRPGAGAPKGNTNALRSGRYATPDIRTLRRRLTDAQWQALLPLRRSLTDDEWRQALAAAAGTPKTARPRLIEFSPRASEKTSSSSTPIQSNLDSLAFRMTAHGFFAAIPFLRRHFPALSAVTAAVDRLDELLAEDPEEYDRLNPGRFLNGMAHELSADQDGSLLTCRYCQWTSTRRRKEHTG